MQRDAPAEPRLSRDRIAEYLSHLGLGHVDPAAEQIGCWVSLQAFVANRVTVKPLTRPIRNTRLKTYGLEQAHPVRMLIRHVIY